MGAKIRGVLFDLDGTLYEGDAAIPGAREAIEYCKKKDIAVRFVTNTTSKPRWKICEQMRNLGIGVESEQIFTAPAAARSVLAMRGLLRCHMLLHEELLRDLEGVESVEEYPQAVVIGDMGKGFSYDRLNKAFRFLIEDEGCAFITLAKNRYFRGAEGLNLDVGSFVAALEYATGRQAELVGKPASAFFEAALASMDAPMEQVVVIGDDLEGDVLGAQSVGLKGILVKTGKSRGVQLPEEITNSIRVIDSVADLPALVEE